MDHDNLISILNPPHEELHATGCSWHRHSDLCDCGAFEDSCARSSVEEQGPPKSKVAGSNPAERDIQIAQLNLAKEATIQLIRDCPLHIQLSIQVAFSTAIEQL